MDSTLPKSKRLQALGQAYLPSPRFKPHLTKLNFTTRHGKPSLKRSLIQRKHSQAHSSGTKITPSALVSPKEASGRLLSTQHANRSAVTLNQSQSKNLSTLSLLSIRKGELQVSKDETLFPMSPAQALKRYMSALTEYEQAEILEYPQVYFLGLGSRKTVHVLSAPNCGYDDDKADYKVVEGDQIAYRYEVLGTLGKGSFGQVIKCKDHKRSELVALKIIRNKQRFHVQGAVEVRVLETLRDNDPEDSMGVVRMKSYMVFRKHICVTFELLSLNLYEFLQINGFQGLSLALIRRFAVQLLITLGYSRENRVIHCDLKPENVLLRQPNRSGIKVIDFGSSCFENSRVYTYIQSRFYRAPEIILGIAYTPAIDMWSLGCILAELFTGYPLFPGESEKEQLALIMEVIGMPPKAVLSQGSRTKLFFTDDLKPISAVSSKGVQRIPGSKTLEQSIRCEDKLFVDFLKGCFEWNKETRMTPIEGLQHPWTVEGMMKEGKSHRAVRKHKSTVNG